MHHQAEPRRPADKLSPIPPRLLAGVGIGLFGLAMVILLVGQYTDADLMLADLYYDPLHKTFPWKDSWFGRDFMHGHVKNAITWTGFLLIGTVIVDLLVPIRRFSPLLRLQLRFMTLAAILEPMLVRSFKEESNLHCPVAIDLYGGNHPLLRLLDPPPAGWSAGHCFPAGHASAGMWLAALAVLWLPSRPRKAAAVFAGGIGIGLFMGWVQQMRGQHFLSHTLATAWLCTALIVLMLLVSWKPLQRAARAVNMTPENPAHGYSAGQPA